MVKTTTLASVSTIKTLKPRPGRKTRALAHAYLAHAVFWLFERAYDSCPSAPRSPRVVRAACLSLRADAVCKDVAMRAPRIPRGAWAKAR